MTCTRDMSPAGVERSVGCFRENAGRRMMLGPLSNVLAPETTLKSDLRPHSVRRPYDLGVLATDEAGLLTLSTPTYTHMLCKLRSLPQQVGEALHCPNQGPDATYSYWSQREKTPSGCYIATSRPARLSLSRPAMYAALAMIPCCNHNCSQIP